MKHKPSLGSLIQYSMILLSLFILLCPGTLVSSGLRSTSTTSEQTIVSKISREIELSPGSDYHIRFNPENLTLLSQPITPATEGLSENVIAAIAKSPRWIQPRLTGQFHTLDDPESYAAVLLNATRRYADEIAFSIACCPSGRVPSADILRQNALSLYEHDQWIPYADIVDADDGTGNYSSTIRYRVLENGSERLLMLPPDMYYWYIVHPKITTEELDAAYGPLWRDYLFDHNDLGYPLLKEKLSTIQYLWDGESYSQPAARLWNVCITQHPTAIEAVSYWIGKTVPYPAVGDRPGQSCIIAHEHNGWCGELQKIAVAAQRAALIPSIATCNVGEDHVWREFYERGWHENDNWWSDTGGAVDQPDVYAYGWGKNMSAVYQWRGDSTILQDTSYYIHEADRITVDFQVKDIYLQPVDGARVIVLVKGPKDITYYKNLVWEKILSVWDTLPEALKGKLLTGLFERVDQRFHSIPDIIDGVTITTWNYTDAQGRCSFQLGKNLEYLFLVQEGNLRKPWQLARHNVLRSLRSGQDKGFTIILIDASQNPQRKTVSEIPPGDCTFTLAFSTTAYQPQTHYTNDGTGRHETYGTIECFFVDEANFQNYKEGKRFTCHNFIEADQADFSVSTTNHTWYLILRNPTRDTQVIVDFSVSVSVLFPTHHVDIVSPDTTLFKSPMFACGDTIVVSGVTTGDVVYLSLDHQPPVIEVLPVEGEWSYAWNSSGASPGVHVITISDEENISSDQRSIVLVDGHPPDLIIDTPVDGSILEQGILAISGRCFDAVGVDSVDVTLNNITRHAIGTTTWNLSWDLASLPLGDYLISVKAVDTQGLCGRAPCSFVLNETGHDWHPQVNSLAVTPGTLTNTSNVVITANVTATGPFALSTLLLFCYNGTGTVSYEMYRYGDHPVQGRHEEDPLVNHSNAPVYGVELGQFPTGQTIGFWLVASDTAHNTIQTEGDSFTIQ